MAKDREKLFGGADDKAISFQRAVFIVCNLKRLIRRPKKDEKHGQGSGTRKRSGADQGANEERSGCGNRRNRSRNPVRRAFTLPTMLCNTFSVALAQQIGNNNNTQVEQENVFTPRNNQNKLQQFSITHDPKDNCLSVLDTLIDGRDRANSYNLPGREKVNNNFEDKFIYNSNNSPQDSYNQLSWQSNSTNQRDNNNNNSNKLSAINNMSSLSCLITPIRRANVSGIKQQSIDKQYESRNFSPGVDIIVPFGSAQTDPHEQLELDYASSALSSSYGRRQRTNSALPTRYQHQPRSTGNDPFAGPFYSQNIAQQQQQSNNHQVFCPVWANAMAQLDSIQSQPRDQARFSHFIGPPSSTPYLMAPEEFIAKSISKSSVEFECPQQSKSANAEGVLRRTLSQDSKLVQKDGDDDEDEGDDDDDDEEEEDVESLRRRQQQQLQDDYERPDLRHRLSGESLSQSQARARAQSCRNDRFDQTSRQTSITSKGSKNSNLEDERNMEDSLSLTEKNEHQQHSTTSPNRSEQIIVIDPAYQNALKRHSRLSKQIEKKQQQVEQPLDQVRMKRFSSAICLVENRKLPNLRMQKMSKTRQQQEQQVADYKNKEAQDSFSIKRSKNKTAQDSNQDNKQMIHQQDRKKSNKSGQNLLASYSGRKGSKGDGQDLSLLEPLDPIILARQRRPSASNQGSVNVDQQALFSAIECNQFERVKTILEKGKANVNSLNGDKLTCLDVAALMRNVEMVRLLQQYNAKESSAYLSREGRANQLYSLYTEARQLVEDLSRSLQAILPNDQQQQEAQAQDVVAQQQQQQQQQQLPASELIGQPCEPLMLATGSLLSSALYEEKQRQLQYWKRRLDLFTQMRYEFERLEIPSPPELVVLQVVGEISLGVKIVHSLRANQSICSATQVAAAVVAATNQQQQQQQQQQQRQQQGQEEKLIFEQQHQPQQTVSPSSISPDCWVSKLSGVRTPPEALRTCRDPKCSHWNTLIGCKPTVNQALNPIQANHLIGQIDSKIISNIDSNNSTIDSLSTKTMKSSERGAFLLKQQKLALFNQILAQQLLLLSYQQSYHQNQSGYPGYFQDDNELLSTTMSPQTNNINNSTQPSPGYDRLATINSQPQQPQIQQLQQRHRVVLNSNTSVPQGVVDGTFLSGQLNNRNNLYHRRQQIGAQDILIGTENISCYTNAFEKCSSIAYKLMTADSRRSHNSARNFNKTFDNSSMQSSTTMMQQNQLSYGTGKSSRNNFENNEQNMKLRTMRDQGNWLTSDSSDNKVIITKYKVEWSLNEQMDPIINSMIIYNTNSYPLECQIDNLTNNQLYYVRVSSGNHRGFSESQPTTPICLSPSSWRQIDGNKRRKYDEEVFKRFTKLILLNKHILDDFQTVSSGGNDSSQRQTVFPTITPSSTSSSNSSGSHQNNKSSLINMLLLDATMPSSEQLKNEHRLSERHFTGNERYNLNQFSLQQQQQQSSLSVRKNLKNFFQSNSFKFHKLNNQNKRGLYLTTVIYNQTSTTIRGNNNNNNINYNINNKRLSTASSGKQQVGSLIDQSFGSTNDKIVVTNDDRLPIIEIINDLVSPAALMSDFYWLLKINGTQWMDIKRLRQQLQKSHSSSTLHLRIKLLSAIEQMQVALNMEDIGRIFYKPILAHDGSMLICTCKQVTNTKLVSNLSIKWTNQHKIIPRHLRKISDSMLNNTHNSTTTNFERQQRQSQQNQSQQQQQTRESFASVRDYKIGSSNKKDKATTNELVHLLMMNANVSTSSPSPSTTQTSIKLDTQQAQFNDQFNAYAITCTASSTQNKSSSSNLCNTQFNNTTNSFNSSNDNNPFSRQQQVQNELYRLCEYCQYALIQRRCTMASASSSSSLASSNDSQWSIAQQSNIVPNLFNTASIAMPTPSATNSSTNTTIGSAPTTTTPITTNLTGLNRCTCNRSNSNVAATLTSSTNPIYCQSNSIFQLYSANNSARNSTSISSSGAGGGGCGPATRSGSMISSTTPTHFASISSCSSPSSRQSQATQYLSSAQKSSTYLMMASLNLYDLLLFNLSEIIEFDQTSTKPLKRGLYLGFVQLQTTVESMRLLVPRSRPNMVPCSRIRDNAHVSKEEWQLLKRFASLSAQQQQQQQQQLQLQQSAARPPSTPLLTPTTVVPSESNYETVAGMRTGDSNSMCTSSSGEVTNYSDKNSSARNVSEGYVEAQLTSNQTQRINHYRRGHLDDIGNSKVNLNKGCSERSRTKSASPGLTRENEQQQQQIEDGRQNQQTAKDCLSISSDQIGGGNGSEIIMSGTHSCVDLASPKVVVNEGKKTNSSKSMDERNLILLDAPKTYQQQSKNESNKLNDSNSDIVSGGVKQSPVSSLKSSPDLTTTVTTNEANLNSGGGDENNNISGKQTAKSCNRCRSPCFASKLENYALNNSVCYTQSSPEETFVRLIGSAARRLLAELKSQLPTVYDTQNDEFNSIIQSLNDDENNRIYHMELIELNSQVSFILLIPSAENVCPVTSQEKSNVLVDNKDYMFLPLQIFETIHISTYEPDLLGKYSRLSAILETDLIVAQHDHRQAFSSNELKSTKSRVNHLQDMVSIADEFWRQLRWIVDVVSFARDKSLSASNGGIKLGTIWRYFDLTPSISYDNSTINSIQTTNNLSKKITCCNDSTPATFKLATPPTKSTTTPLICQDSAHTARDCLSSASKIRETIKDTTCKSDLSKGVDRSKSKISFEDELSSTTNFSGTPIDSSVVPDIILTESSTRRQSKGENQVPKITMPTTTTTTATTSTNTETSTTTATITKKKKKRKHDKNFRERSSSSSSTSSSSSSSSLLSSSSSSNETLSKCSSSTSSSSSSSSPSPTSNSSSSSSRSSVTSVTYPSSTKPKSAPSSRKKVMSCPIRRHSGDTLHASAKLVIDGTSKRSNFNDTATTIEFDSRGTCSLNSGASENQSQCQVKCTIFADDLVEVEEIREDEVEDNSKTKTRERTSSTTTDTIADETTNILSVSNNAETSPKSIQIDERILDFQLREASEDEEAIYAYHISLKDATESQRRTSQSQHSVKAFVGDNYDEISENNNNNSNGNSNSNSNNKSGELDEVQMSKMSPICFTMQAPLSTGTQFSSCRSTSKQAHQRQNSSQVFDDDNNLELASGGGNGPSTNSDWIEDQLTNANKSTLVGCEAPVEAEMNFRQPFEQIPGHSEVTTNALEIQQQQQQKTIGNRKRHLKPTNPFLSDSLEYDLDGN